jgi:hypothetical protein
MPADVASGVNWWFRYNGGSTSAFKWEFIGGQPIFNGIAAEETQAASTVWGDVTTVGPSLTLPRAGEYEVEWGMYVRNASAAVQTGNSGISRVGDAANTLAQCPAAYPQPGATAPTLRIDASVGAFVTSMTKGIFGRNAAGATFAANDVLRVKYYAAAVGGSGIYFGQRWMRITPVRVS